MCVGVFVCERSGTGNSLQIPISIALNGARFFFFFQESNNFQHKALCFQSLTIPLSLYIFGGPLQ